MGRINVAKTEARCIVGSLTIWLEIDEALVGTDLARFPTSYLLIRQRLEAVVPGAALSDGGREFSLALS